MIRIRAAAYFALLLAIAIWGANFVVVKRAIREWDGNKYSFLAFRFGVACLVYYSFLFLRHQRISACLPRTGKAWYQAIMVGVVLTVGYIAQTSYLSAGKAVSAAFLTSTTVIWVPFISVCVPRMRKTVRLTTLIGAAVAFAGIFLIDLDPRTLVPDAHSLLALFAALAFGVEIVLVSLYAPRIGSVQWTAATCLVVTLATSIIATKESMGWNAANVGPRLFSVFFTGVFATAVALGLQNWAQAISIGGKKVINGPRAAILGSLEPVFTIIVSSLTFYEIPGLMSFFGCILILAGTLTSELAAARRLLEIEKGHVAPFE